MRLVLLLREIAQSAASPKPTPVWTTVYKSGVHCTTFRQLDSMGEPPSSGSAGLCLHQVAGLF